MSQFKNNKLQSCHRLGHETICGVNQKGIQVKVCKKCGTIWKRNWIKDITLTNKNLRGNIDFTKYEQTTEQQVIMNEARESN